MTKFEAVRSITDTKEFSKIIWGIAEKTGTPEEFERELSMEISEGGLQTLKSIAQRGVYPLSLDGMQ